MSSARVFICYLVREEQDAPDEVTFVAVARSLDSAMLAGEAALEIMPEEKGTWRSEDGGWVLYCGTPGRAGWLTVREVELLS